MDKWWSYCDKKSILVLGYIYSATLMGKNGRKGGETESFKHREKKSYKTAINRNAKTLLNTVHWNNSEFCILINPSQIMCHHRCSSNIRIVVISWAIWVGKKFVVIVLFARCLRETYVKLQVWISTICRRIISHHWVFFPMVLLETCSSSIGSTSTCSTKSKQRTP